MRFQKKTDHTGRKLAAGLVFSLMLAAAPLTAWAGEWQQTEDGGWRYEEAGETVTGWIQADGVWYYLDPATGLWDEQPPLNEESACYLLENAVNAAGWYQSEERIKYYKVDSSNQYRITVSIMVETAPDEITTTLNTFDISRRERTAKSQQTKLVLDLYPQK